MAFLNPLLLFGAGAISVPIIIHLLTKRKIKRVVWAAMQFLQTSVQRNQRRINLEDLILLALRCLLLLMLALALARPAFRRASAAFFGKGSETAVIAIDNSYSMSATDGVTSRFDKAKKAAEQIIDAMPTGSSAAVLFASDTVRRAIPEPTFDFNLARKIIRDGALSDHATDHRPALRESLDILGRHAGSRKTIYLVTDNQALGWRQLGEIRRMLDAAKLEVKTRLVIVGDPEERNLGVSDLRLASALAPANQSVRFEVEVTNYGREDAANVQVGISVDGEQPSDEAAIESIPAATSKAVSLFVRFREPGGHSVTAKIAHDHLPADDERTVAVRAIKEINVLLVDGDPGAEARESEVFFLEHALTPVPPAEKANYFIKTKTISPGELEAEKLSDFEAVVLANVIDVSDTTLTSLDRYLRRGGGLIVFPGAKINANFYNEKMAKQSGFLPATFGSAHGNADDQENFFHLQDKGYDHPIVSPWKDPAAGTLATAHFYRAFELKPVAAVYDRRGGEAASHDRRSQTAATDNVGGEPQVVVRYSDGAPAVIERTWGFGRVVQFGSTASTKWNDLPVRPVFVPLVHRTLGAIVNREDERLNVRVGTPFEFACDYELTGKDATITRPGGTKAGNVQRRVTAVNGVPILKFDETDVAGAYDVSFGAEASTASAIKFAAQPDPAESKLEELHQAEIDSLAPAVSAIRWTPGMNLVETFEKERSGSEIWLALALCALAVACAETVLADRFSYAK
jgi:aerotolerance regulator-like protein/VWA domain-containing protein/CARDB protein